MRMMLRLMVIGFAVGLAVTLFATRRGREVRDTLTDTARSLLDSTGLISSCCGQAGDGDLQERIEETRRRLKEQMAAGSSKES